MWTCIPPKQKSSLMMSVRCMPTCARLWSKHWAHIILHRHWILLVMWIWLVTSQQPQQAHANIEQERMNYSPPAARIGKSFSMICQRANQHQHIATARNSGWQVQWIKQLHSIPVNGFSFNFRIVSSWKVSNGLMIIYQQAAHEQVLYDKFMRSNWANQMARVNSRYFRKPQNFLQPTLRCCSAWKSNWML